MSDYLFSFHPATVLALAAGALVVFLKWPMSWSWFGVGLVPIAAVSNSLLWYWGTPLVLGWRLGGLGGWVYLYEILPLNGALSALAVSLATETAVRDSARSAARNRVSQIVSVLIVLVANLLLARFGASLRGNLTD